MKQSAGFLMICSLAVTVGCGSDGDDDGGGDGTSGGPDAASPEVGNPGFAPPTQVPVAYLEQGGVWVPQGPADFSCLNAPSDDEASTEARTLSGLTNDFQREIAVESVELAMFDGADVSGTPLSTAISDGQGQYSLEIPAGTTRVAFRSVDPEGTRFLDTYLFNQFFAPSDTIPTATLSSVSINTANALPAFIGVTRTDGLGVLAGAFRDCQAREVQGVVATVTSSSCVGNDACTPEHLDGAQTYYFSAGDPSLPVRHTQALATQEDGLFVVLELPPTASAFVQIWGFPTQADLDSRALVLLSEITAPVLADAVIQGSIEVLRSAN